MSTIDDEVHIESGCPWYHGSPLELTTLQEGARLRSDAILRGCLHTNPQ